MASDTYMNDSTTTSPIKCLLQEFVGWLETAYGSAGRGAASEFAIAPPSSTMAIAEGALEAALNGGGPVHLGSSSMRSIIGALLLRRAGIELEQVFAGRFTDAQFEKLINTVTIVKNSKLVLEWPVEPNCDTTSTN
jgi:hypothetical protein